MTIIRQQAAVAERHIGVAFVKLVVTYDVIHHTKTANIFRLLSLGKRGGDLWCELAEDRVLLKGKAVVTMEGALTI